MGRCLGSAGSMNLDTHDLIASDRVEGTPVRSTDGTMLGTIERVMIDKLTGNVAYAVLSFDGFAGMGQKHLPIPWPRLTYDRKLGAYRLDVIKGALGDAPSDAQNQDFDQGDRGRERYWGIAESW